MLSPLDVPDSFTLRSVTGIFEMQRISATEFEGKANSFVLDIDLVVRSDATSVTAALSGDVGREGFGTVSTEGKVSFFGDVLSVISSWVDHVAAETIEDYASDVKYLDTPDGRIAYWGYNTHLSGVPAVFVHGGPGGDSNPVKARRLMLDRPVYLFDQMGCGMSDPIKDFDAWNINDYIRQMDSVISKITDGKVILIGASWGAGLSLAYASSTDYRRVAGMILISPFLSTAKWNEDIDANLRSMGGDHLAVVEKARKDGVFTEEFFRTLEEYNARFLFSRKEFRPYALVSAREEPNETFRRLCGPNDFVTDGKLKDFDVSDRLSEIDVPTLLMCGDSDEVTIPRIMEYYKSVKGARLSIIAHAGHVLALEQFDQYAYAIRAFLEENDF